MQLLYNHGFEIGYDYRQRTALWVYYRLEWQPKYLSAGRLCSYCADERVLNPVYDDEFPPGRSGYTHGHLAPSSAIAIYFGDYAQRETYYLSNIVVEIGWHNNGIRAQLEQIEQDIYAKEYGPLEIVYGPIENGRREGNLPLPRALYKILERHDKGHDGEVLAFIIPQDAVEIRKEQLCTQLTTVEKVEDETGLTFKFVPENQRKAPSSGCWPTPTGSTQPR